MVGLLPECQRHFSQGEGLGPRTAMHTTCPLALPLLAAAAPLVFGQLLWVSRCFTGSFGIFNGFFCKVGKAEMSRTRAGKEMKDSQPPHPPGPRVTNHKTQMSGTLPFRSS